MSRFAADRPDTHYDNISAAWRLLMGESFHYGYFENPEDSLDTATEALTKQMALRAEIEPHHRVVDAGCGIGGPALYLAEHIGCHVSGLSTSPIGIATAKERAVERGFEERVDFSVRDAMDNRFDDRSFDRVWVMESSHLMPDKSRMIHESARVLKPGGRLVLCDIIMQRDLSMRDIMKRAKAFDLLRVVFGRAKMETLNAYRKWCEDAGFQIESCEDISQQTSLTFARWKENAGRYDKQVRGLVGEKALTDFVCACEELERMWQDQILGYGILSARLKPESIETG